MDYLALTEAMYLGMSEAQYLALTESIPAWSVLSPAMMDLMTGGAFGLGYDNI